MIQESGIWQGWDAGAAKNRFLNHVRYIAQPHGFHASYSPCCPLRAFLPHPVSNPALWIARADLQQVQKIDPGILTADFRDALHTAQR